MWSIVETKTQKQYYFTVRHIERSDLRVFFCSQNNFFCEQKIMRLEHIVALNLNV